MLDNLLVMTARLIRDTFREYDWAFRYDSRVFAVILHECDLALATLALGRLNKRIEEFDFPLLGKVSFSMGYIQLHDDQEADRFIDQASQALRQAQEDGGDAELRRLPANGLGPPRRLLRLRFPPPRKSFKIPPLSRQGQVQ